MPTPHLNPLRLLTLWIRVEQRARRARKTGNLVTVMPTLIQTPGHPNQNGYAALAYRPNDPYAITLYANTTETLITATFARDLFARTIINGHSGHNHGATVHIERVNQHYTRVSLDTTHPTTATLLLPHDALRRATQAWYDHTPFGAETIDYTDLENHLTQAA